MHFLARIERCGNQVIQWEKEVIVGSKIKPIKEAIRRFKKLSLFVLIYNKLAE